jgi:hypothetical protein
VGEGEEEQGDNKKFSADLHSLLTSAMYYRRYQEEYKEMMKE